MAGGQRWPKSNLWDRLESFSMPYGKRSHLSLTLYSQKALVLCFPMDAVYLFSMLGNQIKSDTRYLIREAFFGLFPCNSHCAVTRREVGAEGWLVVRAAVSRSGCQGSEGRGLERTRRPAAWELQAGRQWYGMMSVESTGGQSQV